MTQSDDNDPIRRRDVVRFVGFTAAAILWAASLVQRDDVGLIAILVLAGWAVSAALAGSDLWRKHRSVQRATPRSR